MKSSSARASALFFVIAVAGPTFASAKQESSGVSKNASAYDGCIRPKTQIEVEGYEPKSGSYHIIRVAMPNVGRNTMWVTPESLARGVTSISLEVLRKRPRSVVGTVFSTDNDLDLISPIVIAQDPKYSVVREKMRGPAKEK